MALRSIKSIAGSCLCSRQRRCGSSAAIFPEGIFRCLSPKFGQEFPE
uniref:Transcriptional regulator SEHBP n=1 Tax=Homo sapiens TaxID=9606 RepID=SEHBP_HUMAN|nr:RecName: Full=Transcriptional regulator SEHBP; AltName: Full=Short ORF-encoded histone-binding protein; AltName: Full=ZNF689 upstream open reading frame protein [Homo sapiens]